LPLPPGALEIRLGHAFADKTLLLAALTHPSYAAEHSADAPSDNQRLEFLGDAALGLVAAEYLHLTQPGWHEGRLTKVRSRLTNETALARVARALDVGAHLRLGRGEERTGGRDTPSNLADAMEALIGALWLDAGPGPVRNLFRTVFADLLREAVADATEINPKGELQELTQRLWQDHPEYTLLSAEGPPHRRHYRVSVSHRGVTLAEGEGTGIRRAESAAAAAALAMLRDGRVASGK
jgi:ribonuclease-3